MPYDIRRNYRGKSGYSVIGPDGKVHGTHPSRTSAIQQQRALYAAEAQTKKFFWGYALENRLPLDESVDE